MAPRKWHSLLPFLWLLSLCFFAYFFEDRTQVYGLLIAVAILLFSSFYSAFKSTQKQLFIWNVCFAAAAVLLLFVKPILSDDFYRFAWDGYLLYQGVNVYVFTPENLLTFYQDPFLNSLYPKLNSGGYYSIYLPVNQWVNALPFVFGARSIFEFVLGIRLIYALIGGLGFWALQGVLSKLGYQKKWALVVLGHPLLWIEGYANVHIEFLLLMLLFSSLGLALHFRKTLALLLTPLALALKMSAFPYALLLFSLVKQRAHWAFLVVGSVLAAVLSMNTLGSFNNIEKVLESLALFSRTFEFNGLVYEGVNSWISSYLGYNAIAYTGPVLNVFAWTMVAYLSLRMFRVTGWREKVSYFQWICIVFLLCANTVHPWYLLIPISTLCFIFNPFLAAWSATVFLSYFFYQEYRLGSWILLEYGLPVVFLFVLGSRVKIEERVSQV